MIIMKLEKLGMMKRVYKRESSGYKGDKFSQILARAYVFYDEHSPMVAQRLRRTNDTVGKLLSSDLKRILFDTKPALKNFSRPVLIIQGRQDIMIDRIAQITHKTLTNSRVVILDNCGHYGWLDQPQIYFSTVLAFLAD